MANILWSDYPAAQSLLGEELDSLADGANKLSANINNSVGGKTFLDLQLYLAAPGGARAQNAYVAVYILPAIDGTNYVYGSDTVDPPPQTFVGNIAFTADTTARYSGITHILTPATHFKVLIINETGQAFASTGNALSYVLYNEVVS